MPCELLLPKGHPRDKKICANYVPGSGLPPTLSCMGDSGGPLTVNEKGHRVILCRPGAHCRIAGHRFVLMSNL